MSSVVELRAVAKTLGIRGYSVAKKADLISLIEAHQMKKYENKDEGKDEVKKEVKVEVEVEVKPEEVKEEVKVKPNGKRNNEWNNFLADFRKENNMSLKQAMSSARDAYTLKRAERIKADEARAKA